MKNPKKIIKIALASVTGLFGVGVLLLAWTFSSNIMHPTFECSEEHFIYCGDPSQLDLAFEDVVFQSDNGIDLNGWYIPAENSNKAIMFVHGHGADRHEGMRWFKVMHQAGFNILTFDLRNSGANVRSFSSMGYFEKNDVKAAIDYLQQQNIQSIGIFGTSMGATTAIMAMERDPRIGAGVFEAGWANLQDLYSDIIKQHLGLPVFPLLPLTTWLLERRTGMHMDALNPEEVLGNIAPRPVFVIHCSGDSLIGISHGERNYAAANEPKEFWKSPCQMHARAWQSDPQYIEKRVADYYLKYL
ncbi:MAG: alpha/beta hydrolase [Porticoccaceae bacterium]|nr:alpha/beta hydrolase [Porticoccaceae bacterium]